MIPRYSRPEVANIWSDENKYSIWFKIEAYACEAMAKQGLIEQHHVDNIWKNGKFSVDRINEIEKTTKHDVIAFLTNLAENIGDSSRFVHMGMTSSDVLDTCLAVQLKQAGEILLKDIETLLKTIKKRAEETKYLVCIGRSHGIHAEPVTYGIKFATFYAEFDRQKERLEFAIKDIATCAISGAVGTFANIDPFIESYVAEKMGLAVEPVSTQVIPRDRHANFFAVLAGIASSVERFAVEIRHLQRTEVLEVEENFTKGQKGSSAMPHKRNPVLSENITGIARLIRSYSIPAFENVALWHERDISHSSVERIAGPDATVLLDFALYRLNEIIANLLIHENNIEKNLNKMRGLVFSQRVLLTLIEKGISREDAYAVVQENAMKVWNDKECKLEFSDLLKQDKKVVEKISHEEIDNIFDLSYHTKNVDVIFNRVFK